MDDLGTLQSHSACYCHSLLAERMRSSWPHPQTLATQTQTGQIKALGQNEYLVQFQPESPMNRVEQGRVHILR